MTKETADVPYAGPFRPAHTFCGRFRLEAVGVFWDFPWERSAVVASTSSSHNSPAPCFGTPSVTNVYGSPGLSGFSC